MSESDKFWEEAVSGEAHADPMWSAYSVMSNRPQTLTRELFEKGARQMLDALRQPALPHQHLVGVKCWRGEWSHCLNGCGYCLRVHDGMMEFGHPLIGVSFREPLTDEDLAYLAEWGEA